MLIYFAVVFRNCPVAQIECAVTKVIYPVPLWPLAWALERQFTLRHLTRTHSTPRGQTDHIILYHSRFTLIQSDFTSAVS
jgi:hypothetical protein